MPEKDQTREQPVSPVKPADNPTESLPTDRISFKRQLELLRAHAAASEGGTKTVKNADVAGMVKLNASTVSLANPFFEKTGLLERINGGYLPSAEVLSYLRAYEWDPETAAHKLGPVIQVAWFGTVLLKKLAFRPMEVKEAVQELADASSSGSTKKRKNQLGVLLEYLEVAGLIERDGTRIRRATIRREMSTTPSPADAKPSPSPKAPPAHTAATVPGGGGVNFQIAVNVDMAELSGWGADRITAFFSGVAKVLSAKANLREDKDS